MKDILAQINDVAFVLGYLRGDSADQTNGIGTCSVDDEQSFSGHVFLRRKI